jgi:hypothetical protein
MPEFSGIEEVQLIRGITEQLANTPIVEQQTTILVDNVQPGGAMFENLPKLALVFCNILVDRFINGSCAFVGIHLNPSGNASSSEGGILATATST